MNTCIYIFQQNIFLVSYVMTCFSCYTFRFNNVEESSMMNGNKRHFQAFSRVGQPKRMKLSGLDAHVVFCSFLLEC